MELEWKATTLAPGVELRYQVEAVLFSGRTRFQQVDLLRTVAFGRALFLDGDPQSAEFDEHIYHEALVHPALVCHPRPRSVLIAGGGEGATLREVLRHRDVERVVMVDIDAELVELCRRELSSMHQGAFDDPRAELRCQDAFAYLRETGERFDAVILDLTAPIQPGPSRALFGVEFYETARARLAPGGVLSLQAQSASPNNLDWHLRILRTLASLFPTVRPCQVYLPFFGEPWGFAVASDGLDPLALGPAEVDRELAARLRSPLRFYDGQTHRALFSLPLPLRRALKETARDLPAGGCGPE